MVQTHTKNASGKAQMMKIEFSQQLFQKLYWGEKTEQNKTVLRIILGNVEETKEITITFILESFKHKSLSIF